MKPFADRLVEAIRRKQSRVVVGLDPRLDRLPREYQGPKLKNIEHAAQAVLDWGGRVIETVAPHAAAVKPQSAFYELLGPWGVVTYFALCRHARRKGLLVIGDVKRGDVPDTAEAYATAHLESFDCDAITINPYLGSDAVKPFLEAADRNGAGLFVLVKTSNPGSGDFQDLDVGGRPLHQIVAERVAEWGRGLVGESGYSSVGAVVGATHPAQAAAIRALLPKSFLLIPGYGAQGATAGNLKGLFDSEGLGAVVNASRSVLFAHEKAKDPASDWTKEVERAVVAMKNELNTVAGGRSG